MKPFLGTTFRLSAAGYVSFAVYRLLSLALSRPWGPEVYAYPIAGFFGDLSLVLAIAAVFGGAAAGASHRRAARPVTPALGLAFGATLAYGLLHPAVQHLLLGLLLGSPPPGGPEFPWDSLRLAAELRAGTVPEGPLSSNLRIPSLLVLNAWTPLWIFGLTLSNAASGYLGGQVQGAVPVAIRAWALALVSAGGFLGGLELAIAVTRAGVAPLWVALTIPLAVPGAVLLILVATRPRRADGP